MGSISNSHDGMAGTRSISAFFLSQQAASAARAELVAAGLSFEAVKITDGQGTVTGRSSAAQPAAGGLLDTIKNAFTQDQPSFDAERGRPGHVVTAHVPAALFERASAILSRDGDISQTQA